MINMERRTHVWVWIRGVWRCRHCQRSPRTLLSRDKADLQPCIGPAEFWQQLIDKAKLSGHDLMVFPDAKRDIIGCGKCGALAQVQAHNLARQCSETFSSHAMQVYWDSMLRTGIHPTTGELVGKPVTIAAEARRVFALDASQAMFLEEDEDSD